MVLLVVHFLQCAVFPPILPNLQEIFPRKYARNCDGDIRYPVVLDFDDKSFPDNYPVMEKCEMSLAELFIRFLDYYSRFDFGHYYICMRDAAVRRRDGRDGSPRVNEAVIVFIRDPIDDHNPGRTVRDVEYLQNRMRRTLRLFQTSKKFPNLRQIP
ncbi:PAP/25A associated domain protein [Ostertagia ostertagi]